jgi:methionyl-tRNA formyltransferase
MTQPKCDSGEDACFIRAMGTLQADLIWVHSCRMILGGELPASDRRGGLNAHRVPPPRNRSCNEIQRASIHGKTETGGTLHEISPGIREPTIIDQRAVSISVAEDWLTLRDGVARVTGIQIASELARILLARWSPGPRRSGRATHGSRHKPEDGWLDWVLGVWHSRTGQGASSTTASRLPNRPRREASCYDGPVDATCGGNAGVQRPGRGCHAV